MIVPGDIFKVRGFITLYRTRDMSRKNTVACLGEVFDEFALLISVTRKNSNVWVFLRTNSISGWARWDLAQNNLTRIS